MNKDFLKENRIHGDTAFPFGIYSLKRGYNEALFDYHWHDEQEFLLITEGTAIVRIESDSFEVSAGQAIFINSGEIHTAYSIGPSSCVFYAMVFSPVLLSGSSSDALKNRYFDPIKEKKYVFQGSIKDDTAWGRDILAALNEMMKICDLRPFAYELAIKAHLYMIFSILLSKSAMVHKTERLAADKSLILKKVIEYIQLNYSSKITLQTLATLANMSEGHFCRFFKRQVRQTPVNYINYHRILKAASLLEHTDKKILEIAFETGFENFSYFITIFKNYMKCTPSEYRKRIWET